ncbi:hypothetical protein [Streptomyces niveus]|uniref:hypothetical protein n=1 Tax=Streptomyces niveus TaxID=193462 RepID=UPI0038649081
MKHTRLIAAVLALIVLAALVVGCRSAVDEWSPAPSPGIELDIDAPKKSKTSKPKTNRPAPAYKAPSRSRR